MSFLSISPSSFLCLTHLLLSPYDVSLDFSVHTFFPYLPVLKAQAMRISARGREVWLSGPVRPQHTFFSEGDLCDSCWLASNVWLQKRSLHPMNWFHVLHWPLGSFQVPFLDTPFGATLNARKYVAHAASFASLSHPLDKHHPMASQLSWVKMFISVTSFPDPTLRQCTYVTLHHNPLRYVGRTSVTLSVITLSAHVSVLSVLPANIKSQLPANHTPCDVNLHTPLVKFTFITIVTFLVFCPPQLMLKLLIKLFVFFLFAVVFELTTQSTLSREQSRCIASQTTKLALKWDCTQNSYPQRASHTYSLFTSTH